MLRAEGVQISPRYERVSLTTRLCPLQILGKRATGTAHKARSCLRMLSLEANVDDARVAVRSLLSDMGVESALWTLPNIHVSDDASPARGEGDGDRCFPESMPLGDMDHMLHLAMKEGDLGFLAVAGDSHRQFENQLNGLAKFFSKRECVELYTQQHIVQNATIPKESKSALISAFNVLCPTFVPTRWQFSFEVVHWLAQRQGLTFGCIL